MNIYIKTFNRPPLLDRCLSSISKFVRHCCGVIILDDGTPSIYLDKIRHKYPFVEIRQSKEAAKKAQVIASYTEHSNVVFPESIPVNLWQEIAEDGEEYVCVIEDDMWFQQHCDLKEIENLARQNDSFAIKLSWMKQKRLQSVSKRAVNDEFFFIEPLHMRSKLVRRFFKVYWKYLQNTLRRATTYLPFQVLDDMYVSASVNPYLTYSVAGVIVTSDYWKHIWRNANTQQFDESVQLLNHFTYINANQGTVLRPRQEMLSISCLSSAYRRKGVGIHAFDHLRFNGIINEAWLQERLDAAAFLPQDIPVGIIEELLCGSESRDCNIGLWHAWRRMLAERYVKQGFSAGPFALDTLHSPDCERERQRVHS